MAEALLSPAIPSVAARAGGIFFPLAKALCLSCGWATRGSISPTSSVHVHVSFHRLSLPPPLTSQMKSQSSFFICGHCSVLTPRKALPRSSARSSCWLASRPAPSPRPCSSRVGYSSHAHMPSSALSCTASVVI